MTPADLAYVLSVLRREWKFQKAVGPALDHPEAAERRQAAIVEAVRALEREAKPTPSSG